MKYLFDADKLHFTPYYKSPAAPLYYAAHCGFHDLVEHLIIKYPDAVGHLLGWWLNKPMSMLILVQKADLCR
jgi:hypothetical protein